VTPAIPILRFETSRGPITSDEFASREILRKDQHEQEGIMIKKIIFISACALVTPLAFAQTGITDAHSRARATNTSQSANMTDTSSTTTTSTGTVTTYTPGKRIVVRERDNPMSYALGKTVRFVNKAGSEIDEHLIRPGKRVIVHWTGSGEHRTVNRVVVEDGD
jgi:hypothetical protein